MLAALFFSLIIFAESVRVVEKNPGTTPVRSTAYRSVGNSVPAIRWKLWTFLSIAILEILGKIARWSASNHCSGDKCVPSCLFLCWQFGIGCLFPRPNPARCWLKAIMGPVDHFCVGNYRDRLLFRQLLAIALVHCWQLWTANHPGPTAYCPGDKFWPSCLFM